MHAVAAGLANGVERRHSGSAVPIDVYSSHEVMLCGNDGNRFLCDVVAFGQAVFVNMLEMVHDFVFRNIGKGESHVVGTFYSHLPFDSCTHYISWLKLVGESLPLCIQQHGSFAAAGFRDKECASGFGSVERCGVNLHVIGMLERYAVSLRDA